jgi:DNA repair protein RecN (Recombination protein N)
VGRLDDEELGATKALAESTRLLRDLGRLDVRTSPHLETLERITGDMDSLISDLRDYAETIEVDAGELQQLEERINLLATLRRKYGPTLADVIAHGEESGKQLERLSGMTELRAAALKQLEEASAKMHKAAVRLGAKRRDGAKALSKRVVGELTDLGFKQAGFEIRLDAQEEPGPDGAEMAEFLFAPNPGEPVQPLRSIASSGEISRVMLALKTALADQDRIPLLVFDEIDANVGGEIATRVASKMSELGAGHQVLCITHLPQVAAAAAAQFMVIKSVNDGRTETTLSPVEGGERIAEIARMLGGVTDSAKAHATTLLKGGRERTGTSSKASKKARK